MAGKSITNFRSSGYTLEQGPQNQRAHQAQGHQSLALSSSYFFAMLTQLQKLERKTQLLAALFFIKPFKASKMAPCAPKKYLNVKWLRPQKPAICSQNLNYGQSPTKTTKTII